MAVKSVFKGLWWARTPILAVLIPILALPLPILVDTKVARCGYGVIVIAFYWVTEVVPLAVTSLLPVAIFPMMGVLTAQQACSSYVKDTLMLFLGSLVVAVAVERWNLHRRLALRILTLVGPHPLWLMLGIMLPCWFLSMWMSNTATTAMMMPIVIAILQTIKECRGKGNPGEIPLLEKATEIVKETDKNMNSSNKASLIEKGEDDQFRDEEFLHLAKTFSLCAAFASNVGGVATLTGTPPNVIFKGQADILFEKYGLESGVDFASWLVIGLPLSVLCFVICWFWLFFYSQRSRCLSALRSKDESYTAVKNILVEEYRSLGAMSFAEVIVTLVFILLAVLWVTRKPGFIPGWDELFPKGHVADSTCAILMAVLLFILPAHRPSWTRRNSYSLESREAETAYTPILTWKIVNEKLAWGVLLLMGGGFVVADACQMSGLSRWMTGHLKMLGNFPAWVVALILSLIVNVTTQVTSNAATTTLFVPIVGDLAIDLNIHPLYFMIPCTIAASFAFLLPVATPPNAIAFSSGYLTVKDMIIAGSGINFASLLFMLVAVYSWGTIFFGLNELPPAMIANRTITELALNGTLA